MTTATKTKKAIEIEVKPAKLEIIKQAKRFTKEEQKPKRKTLRAKLYGETVDTQRALQFVYYDGEKLSASDSKMAIQVWAQLPGYEAGTYFDNKGNVVEPDAIMKEWSYPINSLNRIFTSMNEEYTSMTLEGKKQIKELCKHLKAMIKEAANTNKMPIKLDLDILLKIDFKENSGMFSIYKKEEQINPYEIADIKTYICDKLKEPEIDGNRIRTRHQLKLEKEKRERFFAEHPFLKHPALVNPLYLYWTLYVLLKHGAEKIKISRAETMIYVTSSVGRAVIMLVRDNSHPWWK